MNKENMLLYFQTLYCFPLMIGLMFILQMCEVIYINTFLSGIHDMINKNITHSNRCSFSSATESYIL